MIHKVYEPYILDRLGTAALFCEVVILTLRTVPIGTAVRGVGSDGGGHWGDR